MSNKKAPYEERKVMVSASDLSALVAYRWDAMKSLEERGLNSMSDELLEAGNRCSDKLYKSGFWV